MREHEIIAACLDSRAAFEQVDPHITKHDLSVLAWKIYQSVQDWYGRDPKAARADRAAVLERILLSLGQDKHKQAVREFFQALPAQSSPENAAYNLLVAKRQNKGAELAAAMFDKPDDTDALTTLAQEYLDLLEATSLQRSDVQRGERTARAIVQRKQQSGTVPLYPPRLDRAADGNCMPGHHILIFGRPESGKTLVTLNLVAKFLLQGRTVLYIGNEDPQDQIDTRLLSRLTRQTVPWVEANIETVADKLDPVLERYISVHMTPGTIAEIEREVQACKPDVLVLDQIRNLNMGNVNDPLEAAGIAARAMAGRHQLVTVSVTQAADRRQRYSEEIPIWLGQGDVHGSRTTLPGQCDLMIGLGVNDELEQKGLRAVSLCRNKLSGRHERFMVRVDPARNLILPD